WPPAARPWSHGQVVAARAGQAFGIRIVESEGVGREVVRLEAERRVERRLPRLEGLAGDVVQEVEAHAGGTGRAGQAHRVGHVVRGMPTTKPAQLARLEALCADAHARHPGRYEAGQVATIAGSGVDLDADLRPARDAQLAIDGFEEGTDATRPEQRGRAAAHVDRLEPRTGRRLHRSCRTQVQLG